jgi:WD40 repeat protein
LRLHFRRRRSVLILSAVLWACGAGVIWWVTPTTPREGWQLPASEFYLGFLNDNRTLVTACRESEAGATLPTDLLHLWDIESGRLRTISVGPNVLGLSDSESRDLIKVLSPGGDRLSLHDASSGKRIASFASPALKAFPNPKAVSQSCVFSPDGLTMAVVYSQQVELYDVGSGKLSHKWPDCHEPLCFSQDSRRLSMGRQGKYQLVLDVLTGNEITRLPYVNTYPRRVELSANGSLLLGGNGQLWDVASAKQLLRPQSGDTTFTPDDMEVVALRESGSNFWLSYFEVVNGKERVERRVKIATSSGSRDSWNWRLAPHGRMLIVQGTIVTGPSALQQWLAKFPGYKLRRDYRMFSTSVVVDAQSGKEMMRCPGIAEACTRDGRYVLVRDDDGVPHLWDVPPGKHLRWFLGAVALWLAALPLLAYWRIAYKALVARFRSRIRETHPTRDVDTA